MRIGVFGGTFDPPHRGHLAVCRAAQAALGLDVVEVMPSATPPHGKVPVASAIDRYAMVALMLREEREVVPSPRELLRGAVSYTVDTLDDLRREQPRAELVLIIGADSYDDLPNWREADRIVALAHLAVISRPGCGGIDALRPEDRHRLVAAGEWPSNHRGIFDVPMEPSPLAAREIRAQIASGRDVGDALDSAVLNYARRRGLYAPRISSGETDLP